MTAIGLGLVIIGVVAYFARIFALHRFTYRTWIFDVVVGVGADLPGGLPSRSLTRPTRGGAVR